MIADVDVVDFHPCFCVSMQDVLIRVTSLRGRVCELLSCVRGARCFVSVTVYDYQAYRRVFVMHTHEASRVCGVEFVWREWCGSTVL